MAVKQKTFEFDKRLTEEFEEFCKSRMLVEKKVAAAAVLNFMHLDPDAREQLILELNRWLGQSKK